MKLLALCAKCGTQYDVSGRAPGTQVTCRCGGAVVVHEPRAAVAHVARCGSCGAPRTQTGDQCTFCGSKFVDPTLIDRAKICPGCFIGLPADARFCVECGLKLTPQPLPEDAPEYACPRCRAPLALHVFESKTQRSELYDCRGCGGMWVPERSFDAIVATRETLGAARSLLGLTQQAPAGPAPRAEELVRYIPCPSCKNLMNRRNFAQVSGVIVDSCKGHGVWLDAEELTRIVRFIEAGGMEKARSREHERRQAEVRAEKPPLPMQMNADRSLFDRRPPVGDDLLEAAVRGIYHLLFK
ncbi:MAG: zf-TFIIB domain-containing protein [Planctomycetota bacterium]|nr:zf-TFIIB domain-containing protein [Planctomycetota bacterium]